MPQTDAERLNLPPRVFMYTLDQIAFILSLDEAYVKRRLIHYNGRSLGAPSRSEMTAFDMAAPTDKPEWRVPEKQLIMFMKFKGIKYHERGYI